MNGIQEYIKTIIKAEEERFNHTLDTGLERFAEIKSRLEGDTIDGKDAFMLYDTYGFPLDLTVILATEQGLKVDLEGFEAEMTHQRQRARSASRFSLQTEDIEWIVLNELSPTQFVGYEQHQCDCHIQRYHISEDGKIHLQLDRTPFYAESGGQIADTGELLSEQFQVRIQDVRKQGE